MQAELKPIKPKGNLFNLEKFKAEKERKLQEQAELAKTAFDKTASTWKDKPKFVIKQIKDGREVSTDHKVYGYVSGGTPAHDILPKPGGVLAFRVPYQAKSQPGVLDSRSGGAGNIVVFTRRGVRHPGTKAREFDKQIAKVYRKKFANEMRQILKVLKG